MIIPKRLDHIKIGDIIYHKDTLDDPYLVISINSDNFTIAYLSYIVEAYGEPKTPEKLRKAVSSRNTAIYAITRWYFLSCVHDLAYDYIISFDEEYIL